MKHVSTIAYPVIAIAALVAAVAAHAESPGAEHLSQAAAPSTTTRAQVIAEFHQARSDGSLRVWAAQYNPLTAMKAGKTREQGRTEARSSAAEAQALYGEDSGSFALNRRDLRNATLTTLASAGANLR